MCFVFYMWTFFFYLDYLLLRETHWILLERISVDLFLHLLKFGLKLLPSLKIAAFNFIKFATLSFKFLFCLKSSFWETKIFIPAFFEFAFVENIFAHIFTFIFLNFFGCVSHIQYWILLYWSSSKSFPFIDNLSQFTLVAIINVCPQFYQIVSINCLSLCSLFCLCCLYLLVHIFFASGEVYIFFFKSLFKTFIYFLYHSESNQERKTLQ